MKYTVLFLLAFLIFSCNTKNKESNSESLTNSYESLLNEKKEKDSYKEIIPLLEKAIIDFEESDEISNKIKIDLSGYSLIIAS